MQPAILRLRLRMHGECAIVATGTMSCRLTEVEMDKRRFTTEALALLAVFLVVPLFFYIAGIGCPIKFLTGVSCPGCGMTRAWASVLALDFAHAFVYHPLFLLGPAVPVVACLQPYISQRAFTVALVVIAVLFVVCWAVRMLAFFGVDPFGLAALGEHVVGVQEPAWIGFLHDVVR